ncbi:MAG: primosomal protein N', partial [Candidatus Krumholzibacteriia bacterium]
MSSVSNCQLAEVALPVPLAQTFSYRFTVLDNKPLVRGDLVVVPFGRRKRVVGLVVGTSDLDCAALEVGGVKLKDVTEVLAVEYRLAPDRMQVAHWIADYYLLPLGEVVPLFHPPKPGTKVRKSKTVEGEYPVVDQAIIELSSSQKEA